MMFTRKSGGCAVLAAVAWALPAWAHHSHGNYQLMEYRNLEGTVKEVHWINPHTWIYLEVLDPDGQATLWTLEGGSPSALLRRGWSRESVEVGDNISVRCHPLRSGATSCLLGYLTPEGGVEKEFD